MDAYSPSLYVFTSGTGVQSVLLNKPPESGYREHVHDLCNDPTQIITLKSATPNNLSTFYAQSSSLVTTLTLNPPSPPWIYSDGTYLYIDTDSDQFTLNEQMTVTTKYKLYPDFYDTVTNTVI